MTAMSFLTGILTILLFPISLHGQGTPAMTEMFTNTDALDAMTYVHTSTRALASISAELDELFIIHFLYPSAANEEIQLLQHGTPANLELPLLTENQLTEIVLERTPFKRCFKSLDTEVCRLNDLETAGMREFVSYDDIDRSGRSSVWRHESLVRTEEKLMLQCVEAARRLVDTCVVVYDQGARELRAKLDALSAELRFEERDVQLARESTCERHDGDAWGLGCQYWYESETLSQLSSQEKALGVVHALHDRFAAVLERSEAERHLRYGFALKAAAALIAERGRNLSAIDQGAARRLSKEVLREYFGRMLEARPAV